MIVRTVVLTLALVMSNCASIRVATDADPTASFAGRTAYAWDSSPSDAGRSDPWVSSDLLAERVTAAVNRELAAKGYHLAGEGEPDFLVDFHAAVENVLEVAQTWTAHEGPAGARASEVIQYKRGTLILDFVDPTTRRQIWRGWAMDAVDEQLRPEKIDPQIDEAVGKILARFPPVS
jgi:hypothetical protein